MLQGIEVDSLTRLVVVVLLYVVGFLHVLHALMHVRTSQGTVAWVVSLISVPFVAIPFYWLLGRTRVTTMLGSALVMLHRWRG